MLVGFDLFKTSLAAPMSPADNKIVLSHSQVKRLTDRIQVGNHTYLVIMYGAMREVIRFDCIEQVEDMLQPRELSVIRDIQNTGRKTFPKGACVQFMWVEEALRDLVCSTTCAPVPA